MGGDKDEEKKIKVTVSQPSHLNVYDWWRGQVRYPSWFSTAMVKKTFTSVEIHGSGLETDCVCGAVVATIYEAGTGRTWYSMYLSMIVVSTSCFDIAGNLL